MFDINSFIPAHLMQAPPVPLQDAASAEGLRLHLNENPLGSPLIKWYNRYPDMQQQHRLVQSVAEIKKVEPDNVMLTNGTAHAIDLLHSVFCGGADHHVIICPPVSPLFIKSAASRNIKVKEAPLDENYQLSLVHLENITDDNSRILWLCSPNNPTGNILQREDIEVVLNNFKGLVVIDEAYINFARSKSFLQELQEYQNLVILQSFSIAWGLAGLRVAAVFAHPAILKALAILNPVELSTPVLELAEKATSEPGQVNDMIKELVAMRNALAEILKQAPFIEKIYPSEANFLCIKFKDGPAVYQHLLASGILVKNLNGLKYCDNCLRITVGTEGENTKLVDALIDFQRSGNHHKTTL